MSRIRNWRRHVPAGFYRGDDHPTVKTVGELRRELERLPEELPVRSAFGHAAKLVVYNINEASRHLRIEEGGEVEEE